MTAPGGVDLDDRAITGEVTAFLKVHDVDMRAWRELLEALAFPSAEFKGWIHQHYGATCAIVGELALQYVFTQDATFSSVVDRLLAWNEEQGRI